MLENVKKYFKSKIFFENYSFCIGIGTESLSRTSSCEYASQRTNVFVTHDCRREAEVDTIVKVDK